MSALVEVTRIYEGSSGGETIGLYGRLAARGPAGAVAMNLLRAQKASERAKKYRGGNSHGSYRSQAYAKKQWSLGELAKVLIEHAADLGITWGWAEDPEQEVHRWVLYVVTPDGQVSFHVAERGVGPDFTGQWDGVRGAGPGRVCAYAAHVLAR